MGLSFDDEDSFKEGVGSLNFHNPLGGSGRILLREMNEDICFNNCPSDDSNSLRQVGNCSDNNIPPEERIEIISRY